MDGLIPSCTGKKGGKEAYLGLPQIVLKGNPYRQSERMVYHSMIVRQGYISRLSPPGACALMGLGGLGHRYSNIIIDLVDMVEGAGLTSVVIA